MSQAHAYKPPTMYPDVVIKLGLEKAENGRVFRRITSYQLKEKDDPIQVLRTQAVLLSLSTCEEPEDFCLEDHTVTLTYKDSDGDKVLIHSRDDLLAAMREHFTAKKLKVLALVEKNERKPASRARLTSVESATQTTTTTPAASKSNFEHRPTRGQQPKTHPLPVHDAVEAILGILASATSAVQAHLQEATASASRVETAASTAASTVVENPPVVTTAETSTEAPPSVRSPTRYCLEEETDPQEKEKEDAKPFVHGRHTCDGCLTTPIVGKRFHALNLPDYDLCETCKNNYKGSNIVFEEAELERDRALQERWQRRHALMTSRVKRFTPPQQNTQHKSPKQRMEEKHGNLHNSNHTSPAKRHSERLHCRPHCGPRGRRPPFGPPHHHPPFGPSGFPHGPPPLFFPPSGPPPHLPPHAPPPVHPAPSVPPTGPDDLALKEAIRRSMEDLMYKTEKKVAEEASTKAEVQPMQPKEEVAPALVVTMQTKEEASPAPLVEAPTEVESASVEVKEEPSTSEGEDKGASFASDAEGCGDVATGLGEALDKVAGAINSLNLELNRTSREYDSETNSDDEPDIVVDAECIIADSAPTEVGATIVDGEETEEVSSQNSWQVVVDEDNQITQDEALARAAQVIGSALFNSDVSRPEEVQEVIVSTLSNGSTSGSSHGSAGSSPSADMVSSVTSVPSTIPSISTTGHVTPAQRDRWALQLEQLHELGFYNDAVSVEILERLTAANIGVDDSTSEVNVERVVNEMMKDW